MQEQWRQDVFELVLARVVRKPGYEGLVHVWWRAPEQGERVVQVYVNDRLVAVSTDKTQREMWVVAWCGRVQRIELLAVDVQVMWEEHRQGLKGWKGKAVDVVEMGLVRDERLDTATVVTVDVDGVRRDTSGLFAGDEARGGFGALFGLGEWGYDAAAGCGLSGVGGELGMGPLGSDGSAWRWRREDLRDGERVLAVNVVDARGSIVADGLSRVVEVERVVRPAKKVEMGKGFTLQWQV